ncbi:MAG: hypothetical protein ACRDNW_06465 [Trebonia sp.]
MSVLDIAVAGGKIARIAPGIPAAEAARVLEVRGTGRHVLPGLIDLHAHVADGAVTEGVGAGMRDLDDIGVRSGVTTLADAGSGAISRSPTPAASRSPAATASPRSARSRRARSSPPAGAPTPGAGSPPPRRDGRGPGLATSTQGLHG